MGSIKSTSSSSIANSQSKMPSKSFFNTRTTTFSQVQKSSDEKVDADSFLQACRAFAEVYDVIGGTTFAPLKADVIGNVVKLEGKVKDYNVKTLEEIVEHELKQNSTKAKGSGTDALVWLKRGLWLFCQFLLNVVNGERDAQKAFSSSYNKILAPHHNYFVRKLFNVGLMAFPS